MLLLFNQNTLFWPSDWEVVYLQPGLKEFSSNPLRK